MSRSTIQPQILHELESGRMTDKALAVKLRSTEHGIRSACLALMKKGLIKRYLEPGGDLHIYEARHG